MAGTKTNRAASATGPYRSFSVVDISSADHEFPRPTGCVYCGGAGIVIVRGNGADDDTTLTVSAGSYHPWEITHVRRAGTTATGIVGLYP